MNQKISEHKYLFHHGANYRSYEFLGAHITAEPEAGICFRVWAPRADSVSVVGTFNDWELSACPMKQLEDDPEIWEAFSLQSTRTKVRRVLSGRPTRTPSSQKTDPQTTSGLL